MARGREAYADSRMADAADAFCDAAQVHPDPVALYMAALSRLEAGDPEACQAIVDDAMGTPGVDELDLLELRAAAAWERGDQKELEASLEELAGRAPEMAKGLVRDLEIPASAVGEELGDKLWRPDRGEMMDGYV